MPPVLQFSVESLSLPSGSLCVSLPPSLVSGPASLSRDLSLSLYLCRLISFSDPNFVRCVPACVWPRVSLFFRPPLRLYVCLCLCPRCVCHRFSCHVSTSVSFSLFLIASVSFCFSVSVSLNCTSCPLQPPPPSTHRPGVPVPSLLPPHPTSHSCSQLPSSGLPARLSLGPWGRGAREEGRAAWWAHPFLPFQAGRLGQWAF